ncbi:hypothetical protein WJX73_003187 [Symbiochloris irregularis]|uniref:Uncharacterized protein n=1 Tax=Symbiochloris irregularis TaxID=706552 RepID=A0AAW1PUM9_9CHLO
MSAPAGSHPKLTEREQVWQNGLCGCTNDCSDCCFGCFCLPCMWGRNYRDFHPDQKGACAPCCKYCFSFCGCCCLAGALRGQIRGRYNLAERPCQDCMVHCCCGPCAVCQEAREIKYFKKVDPNAEYVAPSSQQMGAVGNNSSIGNTHAAPGESIADREKVTETKVTERFRDVDRQNPENPAANPNVAGVTGAVPQQQM